MQFTVDAPPTPTAGDRPHLRLGLRRSRHRRPTRRRRRAPTYTYANPGNYLATLTVTDKQGGVTTKNFPIAVTPASSCTTTFRDDFDGAALDAGWSVVRQDQALSVGGGALNIATENGDVYGTDTNNAKNIVLRTAPSGAWTATTKLNEVGNVQYHQAGLIVYGDDDNYTKFDRLATNASGSAATEKFEFINEVAGVAAQRHAATRPANLAATYPADFYMQIESDGTQITGCYSTDGTTWTQVGQAANLPANAKVGVFALDNAAATHVTAKFDYFQLDGGSGGGRHAGPGDEFDGTSLNKTVWNSIVREDATQVQRRERRADDHHGRPATSTPTAIRPARGTSSCSPRITRAATTCSRPSSPARCPAATPRAASSSTPTTTTSSSSTRSPTPTTTRDQPHRAALRGRRATANPQPQVNVPAGTANIWLRLTKAGTNYSGEFSYDGTTWTSIGDPVANAQTRAEVRPLHARRAGRGAARP